MLTRAEKILDLGTAALGQATMGAAPMSIDPRELCYVASIAVAHEEIADEVPSNLVALDSLQPGDRIVCGDTDYLIVAGLEGPEGALWVATINAAPRLFAMLPLLKAAVAGGAQVVRKEEQGA